MSVSDGHRRIGDGALSKVVTCTRWEELGDGIRFHAGLAEALGNETEFRLLNGGAPRVLGRREDAGRSYQALLKDLGRSPG